MTTSRLIAFDLDGTLVDTAPDLIGALNYILSREKLPPLPLASARNLLGAGARRLIERGLEVEGREVDTAGMNRLIADFIDYYAEHIADESRPFDGLLDALDQLSTQGYLRAVCTNKLEWLSRLLLDKLDMTSRFAAICGADTFGVSKPDPVILQQTAIRAGGDIASTIMVGDAGPDVGAACGRAGDRRELRLYRSSDRRTQAGPTDPPYERIAGHGCRVGTASQRLTHSNNCDLPIITGARSYSVPACCANLRSHLWSRRGLWRIAAQEGRVDHASCHCGCCCGLEPCRLFIVFHRCLQADAEDGVGAGRFGPARRGRR